MALDLPVWTLLETLFDLSSTHKAVEERFLPIGSCLLLFPCLLAFVGNVGPWTWCPVYYSWPLKTRIQFSNATSLRQVLLTFALRSLLS